MLQGSVTDSSILTTLHDLNQHLLSMHHILVAIESIANCWSASAPCEVVPKGGFVPLVQVLLCYGT